MRIIASTLFDSLRRAGFYGTFSKSPLGFCCLRVKIFLAVALHIWVEWESKYGGLFGGFVDLCSSILVTEDNDDTRELLVRILSNAGYQVRSAANGSEALTMLEGKSESTLVLLDMMMPVMDGWDFLKDARRGTHRVVCISAVRSDTVDDMSAWEGIDEVLPKPLHKSDLLKVVQKFCGPIAVRDFPL